MAHLCAFSVVWVAICASRFPLCLNSRLQSMHRNLRGFWGCSVWKCCAATALYKKDLLQVESRQGKTSRSDLSRWVFCGNMNTNLIMYQKFIFRCSINLPDALLAGRGVQISFHMWHCDTFIAVFHRVGIHVAGELIFLFKYLGTKCAMKLGRIPGMFRS